MGGTPLVLTKNTVSSGQDPTRSHEISRFEWATPHSFSQKIPFRVDQSTHSRTTIFDQLPNSLKTGISTAALQTSVGGNQRPSNIVSFLDNIFAPL